MFTDYEMIQRLPSVYTGQSSMPYGGYGPQNQMNYPTANLSINPGAPIPNNQFNPPMDNYFTPQYAKGGQVRNEMPETMRSLATLLAQRGRGGDTMLAHINPEEAELLKAYGGSGTVNPYTGLPEFKFKLGRIIGKIAAPVVGSFLGGPAGAIAASALMGAAERGKGNKLKGALSGGARGALYASIAPMLGEMAGINPAGMVGKAAGMNSASLLSQLGLGGAPTTGGGLGFFGNGPGNEGVISKYTKGGMDAVLKRGGADASGASGVLGEVANAAGGKGTTSKVGDLIGPALLATALGGTLARKEKKPKEESLEEYVRAHRPIWGPQDMPTMNIKPLKRNFNTGALGYDPTTQGEPIYYNYMEEMVPKFSHGGYIDGDTGGQEDRVPAMLSDGEFVFKAPAVAAVGGGNNEAGARIFYQLQDEIMENAGKRGYLPKNKSLQQMLANNLKKGGK
jgi:hypothetical protein